MIEFSWFFKDVLSFSVFERRILHVVGQAGAELVYLWPSAEAASSRRGWEERIGKKHKQSPLDRHSDVRDVRGCLVLWCLASYRRARHCRRGRGPK